ncbi:unnamed protein product [Nippostrongylus brasiliensis]|uniref:BMERB domain-containing protein n=1 Tax=Nippostrongylus brasiliensis TaxID=27835 RepID=A0A0N4XG83_NIPBR|nr:unnamed protein product [Nippostrongylus brasiliensis]
MIEADMEAALYIQKEAIAQMRNNSLGRNRILKVVHEIQYELSTTESVEVYKEWFRNLNRHPDEDYEEAEQEGEEYDVNALLMEKQMLERKIINEKEWLKTLKVDEVSLEFENERAKVAKWREARSKTVSWSFYKRKMFHFPIY